jgi:hypothetical protein
LKPLLNFEEPVETPLPGAAEQTAVAATKQAQLAGVSMMEAQAAAAAAETAKMLKKVEELRQNLVEATKQRDAGKAVVDQAGEKVKAAEAVAKQAGVSAEKATKEKEVEVARMWKEVLEARVRSEKAVADAAAAKVSAARRLPTARTHSSVTLRLRWRLSEVSGERVGRLLVAHTAHCSLLAPQAAMADATGSAAAAERLAKDAEAARVKATKEKELEVARMVKEVRSALPCLVLRHTRSQGEGEREG